MSTAPQPGNSQGTSRLRRRIVFELSVEQLPLLDQAEARHGSKRAALLAALEAQALVDELQAKVAELERALVEQASAGTDNATHAKKAIAKLERDLGAAQAAAQEPKKRCATSANNAEQVDQLRREIALLEKALDERDDEMLELEERVVSELYCARCNNWIDTDGWAWERSHDGGRYAYHDACGDHTPGLLGASSWLAYRSP